MLDFEVFTNAFRHVFSNFLGMHELTSEEPKVLPDKYSGLSAKIEITGKFQAILWLNISVAGVRLAMNKLKIAASDEDRLLMDTTGEILNIIVGAGQRNSTIRYDFSLPSAYKGDAYPLRMAAGSTKNSRRFVFEDFEAYLILEQP